MKDTRMADRPTPVGMLPLAEPVYPEVDPGSLVFPYGFSGCARVAVHSSSLTGIQTGFMNKH
jgi:hypothetical protein